MSIDFQFDLLNTIVVLRNYEGRVIKVSRDVPDSFFYMQPLSGNFYHDTVLDLIWNKNTSLIACDGCQYIQEEYTNATSLWKENEKLLYSVKLDPLTKIANWNTVEEKKAEIINFGKSCAIVMCDVNDFKSINDTYGHIIGDQTLIEIAKLFEKKISKNDLVARIGGDEFLLIIETNNEELVRELLSQIRNDVVNLGTKLNIPLSVSIGMAMYNSGDDWDIKREEADSHLYQNKEKIKKRIII